MTFHTPREDRLTKLERRLDELEQSLQSYMRHMTGRPTIPGQLSVGEIRAAQPRRHTTHPRKP